MRESIRVGSVRGIAIRLHWSVLAVAGLLAWGLADGYLPAAAPGSRATSYWILAVLATICFFGSLLAHELAHSLVAQRRGVPVERITLWLFGGVAELHKAADRPHDELVIASAGPAASVAVTIASVGLAGVLDVLGAPEALVAAGVWLGLVNGILAVFNVVPAAPLDGGRILHALVWERTGDRDRATRVATTAGRIFGWGMIGSGLALFVLGAWGGLWFALLGWFVVGAATAESTHALLEGALGGVHVADVMTPHPVTVPDDEPVTHLLSYTMARHHCSAFPVVDGAGRTVGLITLRRLRSLDPATRAACTVGDVMLPIAVVPRAAPSDAVLGALTGTPAGDGRLLVFADDDLVGIVSPSDLHRALDLARLRSPARSAPGVSDSPPPRPRTPDDVGRSPAG